MQDVQIQLPYRFIPRDYQFDLMDAHQRFKIAVIHRRGGKSKTVLNQQIIRTQEKRGTYYYFLPTYRQAKAVIWDELIKKHVPKELVYKMNESELAIYYNNGSIQRFVGCEDIEKHRGINPIDVVFDEFSEMDERIWTAIIYPVLAENNGTATFIFTPKGRNHSWRLLMKAKDDPEHWFTMVKNVTETDGLEQEEIDKARKEMPEALFNQEMMCEFLENAGAVFRRVKECTYEANDLVNPHHFYQIGVDLAKYRDWTVITPIDLYTLEVKPQDRFNQVDWNLQEARIYSAAYKYNNAKMKMDRTGVGDPIVESLERKGLDIGEEGAIVFSERSREHLLNNLAILIEQRKIKIPNDEGLITELEAHQFSLTEKGRVKISVPANMTDDRVMSLALACHDISEPIKVDALGGELTYSPIDEQQFNKFELY